MTNQSIVSQKERLTVDYAFVKSVKKKEKTWLRSSTAVNLNTAKGLGKELVSTGFVPRASCHCRLLLLLVLQVPPTEYCALRRRVFTNAELISVRPKHFIGLMYLAVVEHHVDRIIINSAFQFLVVMMACCMHQPACAYICQKRGSVNKAGGGMAPS